MQERESTDRNIMQEADHLSAQKAEADKLAEQIAEDELLAKAKAETERKAKDAVDRLAARKVESERAAKQKVEEERLAKTKTETEREAKEEAVLLTAQKVELPSATPAKKKPLPKGLVIGIVAVVVLAISGIGFGVLSNLGTPATPAPIVNNPDIDISGEWNGKLDQPGNGVFDMTLILNQDFSGVILITDVAEKYQIIDNYWDGYEFHFSVSEGRHYWGTLENGHLVGFAGWDCYKDCGHWGTFDVSR